MAACPWDRSMDVSIVGDGLYLNGTRIPAAEAPDFLAWLQDVVTGGDPREDAR